MSNSWLQILIPKVQIQVNSLSEISQIRAQKIPIYRVKRNEDGYIITIRRGIHNEAPVVKNQSIYGALAKFVIPVVFIWTMLLVAVEFVTIDYEVRGNLVYEDIQMVNALIEPHFFKIGTFSFFRGDDQALITEIATAFHDYIWIDIQTVGSRLFIDIFDTQVTEKEGNISLADTLYARVSGMVTNINATGCRVLVEIDQVVHIGDPLITCYTPTGFGTDVAPIEAVASGSVYAHVWYEVAIEFPREYGVRMVTGSSHSNLFVNFRDYQLRIWGTEVSFAEFDTRNNIFNPLEIFNLAPITFERVHYYEKSDIILTNEIELIRKRADSLVKTQLSQLMENDFELIELSFLSLEEEDGTVKMNYHATILEDIAN